MKVLIGTTNPSKVKRFEELLSGYDIAFFTLDKVICNDSGLYFDSLPLKDSL